LGHRKTISDVSGDVNADELCRVPQKRLVLVDREVDELKIRYLQMRWCRDYYSRQIKLIRNRQATAKLVVDEKVAFSV
jgi:hypothetical protein